MATNVCLNRICERDGQLSQPVGLRDNFNGLRIGIGLGWLFGAGDSTAAGR
jgi:hypothetical protein